MTFCNSTLEIERKLQNNFTTKCFGLVLGQGIKVTEPIDKQLKKTFKQTYTLLKAKDCDFQTRFK